jgi:hypothetical protein
MMDAEPPSQMERTLAILRAQPEQASDPDAAE